MQTEFNDHDAETVNDAIRAIRANTGIDLFPASSMSVTELAAKLEAEANARLAAQGEAA